MLLGWAALLVSGVSSGCAACASLVVRRRLARLLSVCSAALMTMSALSAVTVSRSSGRLDTSVISVFITVGAILGGYALGASLVPYFTRLQPPPRKLEPAPGSPDARVDAPAFVVLAQGQPETYTPAVVTQAFELLADTDVPVPPDALRVLAYTADRERYRAQGVSPSRPVVRTIIERMEDTLRAQGQDGPVLEAWLTGAPRLSDAIAQAVALGARHIVVIHLGIAESIEYERARTDTDHRTLATLGVRVSYAPPLWSETPLARLVADRVVAALPDGPRPGDGIVLAGNGQPWQWDRAHPSSCEHETFFLQRVRAMLVAEGANEAHVRSAWLDWQDPDVTEVVRHLAALGCDRIAVVPAAVPADSLETTIDLPNAVERAAVGTSISTVVLGAWGDDPAVGAVLAEVATRTAREC